MRMLYHTEHARLMVETYYRVLNWEIEGGAKAISDLAEAMEAHQ